jgi:4-hydroxyphenylpyruvate dioxygenase
MELGAWPVATSVEPMELNIPAVHGAGTTRIYFVDRYREFSIYSVDFVPIPGAESQPPAVAGMHWFGVVQYVGRGRLDGWLEFYGGIFGFAALPEHTQLGILGKGRILESACHVYMQLIEPEAGVPDHDEGFARIAFGVPDVPEAAQALRERGVEFYEAENVRVTGKGAVTRALLPGVMFELVRDAGTPR